MELHIFFFIVHGNINLLSRPEFNKCSERSHPNTRSFRIPDCFKRLLDGRDRIKARKKAISFPCFLHQQIQHYKTVKTK
jgi:hypothetical protein